MLQTIAIRGYRSLREIVLPLRRLTVVTGANGTGKSSLYRALRLLADCGRGEVIGSLAREGGLESVLWAGPEQLGGARRTGRVEGTTRTGPVALELGFASDDFGYLVDLGPTPDGRSQIVVRVRPGDQARGGVRGRGDAHRLDPGAPNARLRRGDRRVRPGIRRGLPVAAAVSQRARRIRPPRRTSRTRRGSRTDCAAGGSTTASGSTRPHRHAYPRSAPARRCCPTTAAIWPRRSRRSSKPGSTTSRAQSPTPSTALRCRWPSTTGCSTSNCISAACCVRCAPPNCPTAHCDSCCGRPRC